MGCASKPLAAQLVQEEDDVSFRQAGWELGRDIALGVIKTSDELADWIARNVASGYN